MNNKKRTLKLAGTSILSVLILSLLLATVYLAVRTRQERLRIEVEIQTMQSQIDTEKSKINSIQYDIQTLDYIALLGAESIKDERLFTALVNTTFNIETGYGTSDLWVYSNNPGGIKCGLEYCVYETKEQGMQALKMLLEWYVETFGYNLKDIRYLYCGSHCGIDDLNTFTELYNKELLRLKGE